MKNYQLESEDLTEYLEDNEYLTFTQSPVKEKAAELFSGEMLSEKELIRWAFEFVRDEIKHSWDIQNSAVTQTAAEVLLAGHGICYGKSNLLAALLRSQRIPTGYCYQKLVLFDEGSTKYCIHAMNAVYVDGRWLRIDARGNKPGIDAQLDFKTDTLAFHADEMKGERDYTIIYTKPNQQTMETLAKAVNSIEMYLHDLPENLAE